MNKKIIYIISLIGGMFFIYNLIWFFGEFKPYNDLKNKMPEIQKSGTHIFVDNENYQYSIKTPDYLCFNGNYAISDEKINCALIVWKNMWKEEPEKGVIITENSIQKQIELKKVNVAVDKSNQKTIDDNLDNIKKLYKKANEKWNLNLK